LYTDSKVKLSYFKWIESELVSGKQTTETENIELCITYLMTVH